MRNKAIGIWVIGLVILGIVAGLVYKQATLSRAPSSESASTAFDRIRNMDPKLIVGPFMGTLPCADCEGTETKLVLIRQEEFADMGGFILEEKYLGENPGVFVTQGTWTVLRGSKANPNDTVYEITDPTDNSSRYYLRVSNSEIRMLDQEQGEIHSAFNYTLTQ